MEMYNTSRLGKLAQIINKLNIILNSWLVENGFDCNVQFSDHFEYDYLNKMISYTLFEDGVNNKLFIEICKSIYNHNYDIFIISFLHELGHYITSDKVTTRDIENKQRFEALEKVTEEDELAYFASFIEWEATCWACNYIKDNPKTVEELVELLEEPRVEFFEYIKEETADESN